MQDRTNDFGAPGLTGIIGPSHVRRDKVLRRYLQRTVKGDVIYQLCHSHANPSTMILAKDFMMFV